MQLVENLHDLKQRLLEDHRKENKDILTRHFYDMSNMMSRNEGVWFVEWLGKGFALEFLLCFLYTVISIAYFVASYIDKQSDNMGPTCDSKTETDGWCAEFWEGEYTYRLKFFLQLIV